MKYQVCRDLTPIEYEALRNDIAENGVLVPVEVDESGDVLDGHHRIRAWQELSAEGIELPDYPRIIRVGMTEEQKRNHARKLNVLRRQMSKGEREAIMVDMRKDGMSVRKIAEATGVGVATVHRTISGVPFGTPEEKPQTITGADGKQYPAKQERKQDLPQLTLPQNEPSAVLEPDTEIFDGEHDQTFDEYKEESEYEEMARDIESNGWDWSCGELAEYADATDQELREAELELAGLYREMAKDARDKSTVSSMSVHFSSESPEHYTPKKIIDAAIRVMGAIDLDPCSNSKETPNVPALDHYTSADDGLSMPWFGRVYMNPPYGRVIGGWTEKLAAEYEVGNVTEAIALVPGRIDTQWWQALGENYHACFVTGRLTFIGNDDPAPFPSTVFYFGENVAKFFEVFSAIGQIWKRIDEHWFTD